MSLVDVCLGKKPSRVIYMHSIIIGIIVQMKKKKKERGTIISIFYVMLQSISGIRFVQRLQREMELLINSPKWLRLVIFSVKSS